MNNIENLKDIIENYSEELKYLPSSKIENIHALLEDIKDRPKSIWNLDVRDEEEYYRLHLDGNIEQMVFGTHYDEYIRIMGNAFLTRGEAEFERERRMIETILKKYSRPFKYSAYNWYIAYSHSAQHIGIDWAYTYNPGVFCFESKEIAQMVVDEIGRDRLVEYWFRVNS